MRPARRRSGRHRSPFTRRCQTGRMTLDTTDTDVTTRGPGVPEETFDVEPPCVGSDEWLASVEKFEDRFLDRELSWLRLNQRVLELAEDEALPLLERVRFTAIFTSNLDEFFMVRVAGLKRRIAAGVAVKAASGLMPREVLQQILEKTADLSTRH